jgi:urease subunit beta
MSSETAHYLLSDEPVQINQGRPTVTLSVWNMADRAIQVGSHFHFFEVNRALYFDREAAFGMRLDIPAGTAVRFEPGDRKEVTLVTISGTRRVQGLNNLTNGNLDSQAVRARSLSAASQRGFLIKPSPSLTSQEDGGQP